MSLKRKDMFVNRYKGPLSEQENAFLDKVQDVHGTLSRNKKLTTHQKLPATPPDSILPNWVKQCQQKHKRGDRDRKTRRVLLKYNLVPRKYLNPEERSERQREQVRAWQQQHREQLLEYNRQRRKDIRLQLERLKLYEKSTSPSSSSPIISTCLA
jgi:hypothetical protein